VDFRLSDDQVLLRDTARDVLANECPTTLLRAVYEDVAASKPLWEHLRSFAPLATEPAADLAIFLEECGYVAAPGAFFPTVGLFGPLVALAGLDVAGDVAAGEVSGTVAVADAGGSWEPHAAATKHAVLDVGVVDLVAVVSPGPRVTLVEPADLPSREVTTIDPSRRVFGVDASALDRGAGSALSDEAFDAWRDRAHLALAAEMVGVARRCFDMALQYAKDRKQFDRPIGAFQAIQHKLAEMSLEVERATAAVQYASMTLDAEADDRTRACHVAKAAAGRAARRCLKDSIQIHGGIGYTWEHDLHLFLRRATASEYLLGTTGWHHDRIADLIF
jgi:hypothetical protein